MLVFHTPWLLQSSARAIVREPNRSLCHTETPRASDSSIFSCPALMSLGSYSKRQEVNVTVAAFTINFKGFLNSQTSASQSFLVGKRSSVSCQSGLCVSNRRGFPEQEQKSTHSYSRWRQTAPLHSCSSDIKQAFFCIKSFFPYMLCLCCLVIYNGSLAKPLLVYLR